MNIFELASTLPNGLHDTEIVELTISYGERMLRLRCHVWVGTADASPELREAYRQALIELKDLDYCIIDKPDPRYPYNSGKKLKIDLAESDPNVALSGHGTAFRFWVLEWNAFIHIRAGEVTLRWEGATTSRGI